MELGTSSAHPSTQLSRSRHHWKKGRTPCHNDQLTSKFLWFLLEMTFVHHAGENPLRCCRFENLLSFILSRFDRTKIQRLSVNFTWMYVWLLVSWLQFDTLQSHLLNPWGHLWGLFVVYLFTCLTPASLCPQTPRRPPPSGTTSSRLPTATFSTLSFTWLQVTTTASIRPQTGGWSFGVTFQVRVCSPVQPCGLCAPTLTRLCVLPR